MSALAPLLGAKADIERADQSSRSHSLVVGLLVARGTGEASYNRWMGPKYSPPTPRHRTCCPNPPGVLPRRAIGVIDGAPELRSILPEILEPIGRERGVSHR